MPEGYSPAAMNVFEAFFRPWMKRKVAVRFAGLPSGLAAESPLVIVANHTSWWDAFGLREIQRVLRPRAPVYTVMLERELARFPFFRRIGAVGIEPGRLSSVRSAARRVGRLTRLRPDSTVLFFPQGRIWPSFRRPLGFASGVELFLREMPSALVMPVGLHLEALASPRPTFFLYASSPVPAIAERASVSRLEESVTTALDEVAGHLLRCGEESARLWPGPFERLPPSALLPPDRAATSPHAC
jgi:hypothetical protein